MTALRLVLVDATFDLIDAAIEDQTRLGRLLGAAVADDWSGFPESLPRIRSAYPKGGAASPWGTVFFVLQEPRTLVGMGGYKGGPSSEGIVEIGYAVAPRFRGQGLATEAARQLLSRAFAHPDVTAVDAHTLAHPNPSTRVLEKLGFQRIGESEEPDVGAIWHWRLQRPAGR